MNLSITNEQKLISRVRNALPSKVGSFLRTGIGDDALVLRTRPGQELVVTCDFSLEGRHFLSALHSPDSIGWKSLARATSDIAAMGAQPRCFLLSLALPRAATAEWLDDFLGGMARAARRFGLVVAGGDTSVHERVIVNITVIGEVKSGRAITRAGARPGDLICVSGRLGEAQLGLEMVRRKPPQYKNWHKNWRARQWRDREANSHPKRQAHWQAPVEKHFYPEPRLGLGLWLAEGKLATAMIDTSDGLSTDLGHLCDASGVGARLFAEKIPGVSMPSRAAVAGRKIKALELALHGGEDYELLFTLPRRIAKLLPREHRGVPLTIIGEITPQKTTVLTDSRGASQPLLPRGWDPFRTP